MNTPAIPCRNSALEPSPDTSTCTTVATPSRLGLLFLLTAMSLPSTAAADSPSIYRSMSPDGTVRFSDRAAPDATLVRPSPLVVLPRDASLAPDESERAPLAGATRILSPRTEPDGQSDGQSDGQIERVEIASPSPEAVLIDPRGPLVVEIGTAPGSLSASGLRAEILLDGETVAAGRTSSLALPAPQRGAHELQVRLIAADGSVHARSESQVLHVRRTLARGMLAPRHPTVADRTENDHQGTRTH